MRSVMAKNLRVGDVIKRPHEGVEYIISVNVFVSVEVNTHKTSFSILYNHSEEVAVYGNMMDTPELMSTAHELVGLPTNKKLLRG